MLYSMTGFHRVRKDFPWGTLAVELSSVNSRYLEIAVRADRELSSFEPLIQNALRACLARGKVVARAEIRWAPALMRERLNAGVLRDYYREIQELQGELGGPVPAVTSLLCLPGVTDSSSLMDRTAGEVQQVLFELLDQCTDGLIKMRGVEGEALERDIMRNLEEYDSLLEKIAARWQSISPQFFEDYRAKITKTIAQLGYEADPARLAQELVILADKWDIAEELTRSSSHASQFRTLLQTGGPVGRKLDFLVQEMNREINTMGSKSASTELRWLVVDGKALLERIREQIQNVE